jgi:hypothetical protein
VVVPLSADESWARRLPRKLSWNADSGMGYVVSAGGRAAKLHSGFGLDGLQLSARGENPFHFRIGHNGIEENFCRGALEVDGHTVSWDVRYRSTFCVTLSHKAGPSRGKSPTFTETGHLGKTRMGAIAFSTKPEESWVVAGWAFRQVLDDTASQHPKDSEMAERFAEAKAIGGLMVYMLEPYFATRVTNAIRDVATGILSGNIRLLGLRPDRPSSGVRE